MMLNKASYLRIATGKGLQSRVMSCDLPYAESHT